MLTSNKSNRFVNVKGKTRIPTNCPSTNYPLWWFGARKSRKQKAESRKQKAESRKQKAESRKQKAESRSRSQRAAGLRISWAEVREDAEE